MEVQRFLIGLGLVILVTGTAWPIVSRIGLGRPPGDIMFQRGGATFSFLWSPASSSALCSARCSGCSIGEAGRLAAPEGALHHSYGAPSHRWHASDECLNVGYVRTDHPEMAVRATPAEPPIRQAQSPRELRTIPIRPDRKIGPRPAKARMETSARPLFGTIKFSSRLMGRRFNARIHDYQRALGCGSTIAARRG